LTLYLDMDGVLMNYEGAIEAAGVVRYRDGAHWIAQPRDTWPPEMVQADKAYVTCMEGVGFWSGIKPMSDAVLLWNFCRPWQPHVLTAAPTDRPGETKFSLIRDRIAQDKRVSIWQHFDPIFPAEAIHICLRHEKSKFSHEGAVLVDDTPGNCAEWTARGGTAILHKDAITTIKILRELGYE
jgi:hypothetical protein